MGSKMLIDASHPEETRVVVARGNRIEEFDFESASRKPLKGNIYLAKVTRVEPSLQAAFVEYGGNRHGFLAFAEIHPDYYQIPVADRLALLKEQEEEDAEDADDDIDNGHAQDAPAEAHDDAHQAGETIEGEATRLRPPVRTQNTPKCLRKRMAITTTTPQRSLKKYHRSLPTAARTFRPARLHSMPNPPRAFLPISSKPPLPPMRRSPTATLSPSRKMPKA